MYRFSIKQSPRNSKTNLSKYMTRLVEPRLYRQISSRISAYGLYTARPKISKNNSDIIVYNQNVYSRKQMQSNSYHLHTYTTNVHTLNTHGKDASIVITSDTLTSALHQLQYAHDKMLNQESKEPLMNRISFTEAAQVIQTWLSVSPEEWTPWLSSIVTPIVLHIFTSQLRHSKSFTPSELILAINVCDAMRVFQSSHVQSRLKQFEFASSYCYNNQENTNLLHNNNNNQENTNLLHNNNKNKQNTQQSTFLDITNYSVKIDFIHVNAIDNISALHTPLEATVVFLLCDSSKNRTATKNITKDMVSFGTQTNNSKTWNETNKDCSISMDGFPSDKIHTGSITQQQELSLGQQHEQKLSLGQQHELALGQQHELSLGQQHEQGLALGQDQDDIRVELRVGTLRRICINKLLRALTHWEHILGRTTTEHNASDYLGKYKLPPKTREEYFKMSNHHLPYPSQQHERQQQQQPQQRQQQHQRQHQPQQDSLWSKHTRYEETYVPSNLNKFDSTHSNVLPSAIELQKMIQFTEMYGSRRHLKRLLQRAETLLLFHKDHFTSSQLIEYLVLAHTCRASIPSLAQSLVTDISQSIPNISGRSTIQLLHLYATMVTNKLVSCEILLSQLSKAVSSELEHASVQYHPQSSSTNDPSITYLLKPFDALLAIEAIVESLVWVHQSKQKHRESTVQTHRDIKAQNDRGSNVQKNRSRIDRLNLQIDTNKILCCATQIAFPGMQLPTNDTMSAAITDTMSTSIDAMSGATHTMSTNIDARSGNRPTRIKDHSNRTMNSSLKHTFQSENDQTTDVDDLPTLSLHDQLRFLKAVGRFPNKPLQKTTTIQQILTQMSKQWSNNATLFHQELSVLTSREIVDFLGLFAMAGICPPNIVQTILTTLITRFSTSDTTKNAIYASSSSSSHSSRTTDTLTFSKNNANAAKLYTSRMSDTTKLNKITNDKSINAHPSLEKPSSSIPVLISRTLAALSRLSFKLSDSDLSQLLEIQKTHFSDLSLDANSLDTNKSTKSNHTLQQTNMDQYVKPCIETIHALSVLGKNNFKLYSPFIQRILPWTDKNRPLSTDIQALTKLDSSWLAQLHFSLLWLEYIGNKQMIHTNQNINEDATINQTVDDAANGADDSTFNQTIDDAANGADAASLRPSIDAKSLNPSIAHRNGTKSNQIRKQKRYKQNTIHSFNIPDSIYEKCLQAAEKSATCIIRSSFNDSIQTLKAKKTIKNNLLQRFQRLIHTLQLTDILYVNASIDGILCDAVHVDKKIVFEMSQPFSNQAHFDPMKPNDSITNSFMFQRKRQLLYDRGYRLRKLPPPDIFFGLSRHSMYKLLLESHTNPFYTHK